MCRKSRLSKILSHVIARALTVSHWHVSIKVRKTVRRNSAPTHLIRSAQAIVKLKPIVRVGTDAAVASVTIEMRGFGPSRGLKP